MRLSIAGRGVFQLEHLVLDVNGTVASGGQLIDGVRERLVALRQSGWQIHWITADTRGRQTALDKELGWPAQRISPDDLQGEAQQKAAFVRDLDARHVVAVGNGSNDALMLREAAVGIAVLGPEGLALDALQASDLVTPGIHAALDLLLDPERLVASWRR
jgi:P-type E1-E2 ATPase